MQITNQRCDLTIIHEPKQFPRAKELSHLNSLGLAGNENPMTSTFGISQSDFKLLHYFFSKSRIKMGSEINYTVRYIKFTRVDEICM